MAAALVKEELPRRPMFVPVSLAEFILETNNYYPSETNYPSETDNSSRYKSGAETNYGAKFV